MNYDIQGVHFHLSDEIKEYLDKRIGKLEFAQQYIVDLNFKMVKDNNKYKIDANISFRWGTKAHIGVDGYEIYEEIDKLMDKIESKVKKEKSKIQDH